MDAPAAPAGAGAYDEDDEDRHFCLRCRQTIDGLDQYVLHRRAGCGGSQSAPASAAATPAADPPHVDPEDGLKAADFFSQLELRSSTTKGVAAAPPPDPPGPRGMLTRSKSTCPRAQPRTAPRARTARRGVRRAATPAAEEAVEDDSEAWRYPPRTHTGGKWRPRSPTPDTDAFTPPPSSGGKWGPPPSHSGGKWRPPSATELDDTTVPGLLGDEGQRHGGATAEDDAKDPADDEEGEDRDEGQVAGDASPAEPDWHPPPSHTRGKWAPGMAGKVRAVLLQQPARKAPTRQYWCGSCNRRLASRRMYERHLQSDLHFRRTLPERQLDVGPGRHPGPLPLRPPDRQKSAHRLTSRSPPRQEDVSPLRDQPNQDRGLGQGRRLGERGHGNRAERCAVCRAKVHRHQIGKHLVSHFHWRSTRTTAVGSVAADLVLDNIEAVVRQSPFQCGLCKFYCNSSNVFRQHWASEGHRERDSKVSDEPGQYWCSPCEVRCSTTDDMKNHLWSDDHREVEAAVNRSVAVVITRRTSLRCKAIGCHAEFRYNAQLGRHEQLHGHHGRAGTGGESTAGDRYQARYRCAACGALRRSRPALQKHVLRAHRSAAPGCFYCGACKLDFPSAAAAAEHRQTRAHRDAARDRRERRRRRPQEGLQAQGFVPRPCPHCGRRCRGTAELRAHLEDEHPDRKHRCALCGMTFALPQEVSKHCRDAHRARPAVPADGGVSPVPAEGEAPPYACVPCGFSTDSRAEIVLHRVLHGPPVTGAAPAARAEDGGGDAPDRTAPLYRCPICSKLCRRKALRAHLNVHTGERPHGCRHCDKCFSRKDSCIAHELNAHKHRAARGAKAAPAEDVRDEQERRLQDAISSIVNAGTASPTLAANRPSVLEAAPAGVFGPTTLGSADVDVVRWGAAGAVSNAASGADPVQSRERAHLCDVCGKCFLTKATLRQHQVSVHGVKPMACSWPGCVIRLRSPAELRAHVKTHTGEGASFECQTCHFHAKTKALLKRHETIHSGEKQFKCEHCDFATRVSSHLVRHRRLHTGAKPFRCPHCSYRCNNPENLRKHVLKTNKHPGKCLYECRFCPESGGGGEADVFATNSAAVFRSHLARQHVDKFRSASAAASYVAGIYDKAADPEQVERVVQPRPRKRAKQVDGADAETLAVPSPGPPSSSAPLLAPRPPVEEDPPTSLLPKHTLLDGDLFPTMVVDTDFPGDVVYVRLVDNDDHIVVLEN